MALYHFIIDDGREHTPDKIGVELDGLAAARIEAAVLAAELLRDRPEGFWETQAWTMTVTDERGLILFAIYIAATAAPATIHQMRG